MLSKIVTYTAQRTQTQLKYLVPLIMITNIIVCLGIAYLLVFRGQSERIEAVARNAISRWALPVKAEGKTPEYSAGSMNLQQAKDNSAALISYLNRAGINSNYSIYFEQLGTGITIKHRENQTRHPASIYKVSLGLLIMHDSEAGKVDLNKVVSIKGKPITLAEVMSLMFFESNNDAMGIFERELGGYAQTQARIKQDFDAQIVRIGQRTTATDLAKVFKKLYYSVESGYLSAAGREKILNLMFAEAPYLQDRIPAAVKSLNKDMKVASKIGTLDGVYQDGALVFAKNQDYVLVILNQNRLTTDAVAEIKQIVKIVFNGFE